MQQIQIPPLAEGEIYLCGFVDANGDIEHVALLPGDNDDDTWDTQMAWAKEGGGDLLNAAEFAVARLKHPDQFRDDSAYWMNEEASWNSGWARCQLFGHGSQNFNPKGARLRARRVRRFKN